MNIRFPPLALSAVLTFTAAVIILFILDILNYSEFTAVLLALFITTLNFLAGIISAEISLRKNEKIFIKIVFGSMVIRLILMLIIVLITILFLDINLNSFIFSIFIFYIFYLIIEVFYLNYRKN